MSLASLPTVRIEDLPIPADVTPHKTWTNSMREMAAHIGPYPTMQIVERFGGLELYVPLRADGWHVADLIGLKAAAILCNVYGRERVCIPVAGAAIRHARRGGVIAAVRTRKISITDGAHILRTSRTYLVSLVNSTDEGETALPVIPARQRDPGQLEMFEEQAS